MRENVIWFVATDKSIEMHTVRIDNLYRTVEDLRGILFYSLTPTALNRFEKLDHVNANERGELSLTKRGLNYFNVLPKEVSLFKRVKGVAHR